MPRPAARGLGRLPVAIEEVRSLLGLHAQAGVGPELSHRPQVLAGGIYKRTSGAGQPMRGGYQRREPEQTLLHELVSRHAQTMLAELRRAAAMLA